MKSSVLMNFSVDKENNQIKVEREFAAPLTKVWAAWTESQLLDQWWAPKPWQAKTKHLDFKEGGYWLYAMVGPEGEEHWARADYKAITSLQNYAAQDAFCDAEGAVNPDFPRSNWYNQFSESGEMTLVTITITYDNFSDLETVIQMGFKEGFTMGLENLDDLLASGQV
ncbi:SRPBCC family protein [Adhaeribacter pallidiroseus]|uniref:Activator of Hsp90 ATPase homologue 1/2-like C-terminal domain-containing protein n=1 Tax=Adhaeribacter pallidiroseus TaxID=2072847 RepID=A0A369QNN8_9BACT|nr:SRPBCC domain-containing protein [Adhaeribacter pallidiroseus]RDC65952.1 hypothetical protein AHMF7616_04583 [Adhaeribacter pallidiroseus]